MDSVVIPCGSEVKHKWGPRGENSGISKGLGKIMASIRYCKVGPFFGQNVKKSLLYFRLVSMTEKNNYYTLCESNLRRKKLYRMNQSSNFLGGSFSNRDNVRAPIQFGRESQSQHLKR